ncbi:MAG: S-methyl-5'-thioadenosine phosphorylase, partial [Actinomycetota bacterium]
IATLREERIPLQEEGVIAIIQGPRFSTRAESRFFIRQGWDVVNMTQYPEVLFARELGLCYAVMVSITDWDVGVGTALSMHSDTMGEVLEIFRRNTQITQRALVSLVGRCQTFDCACAATTISEYYKAA